MFQAVPVQENFSPGKMKIITAIIISMIICMITIIWYNSWMIVLLFFKRDFTWTPIT